MPKAKSTRRPAPIRSSDGVCVGTIMPPRTMLLRVHCGEAECGKLKYRLYTNIAGSPIVHSAQTGKWFTLSWQTIIDLAVKAGIDETHTNGDQL
jgi:hypothetical protein